MSQVTLPTIQLCSPDQVFSSPAFDSAARRGGAARPDEVSEFVTILCQAFSEQFEQETGRWVKIDEYQQVFNVNYGRGLLKLRGFPVLEVTEVIESLDGDFDSNGLIRDPASYYLMDEGYGGLLKVRPGWTIFEGDVRVTYTGGLANTEGDVPFAIVQAAIEQVCYAYKRAPESHLSGVSQGQGSATFFRSVPTLDSVRAVIDRYRSMC